MKIIKIRRVRRDYLVYIFRCLISSCICFLFCSVAFKLSIFLAIILIVLLFLYLFYYSIDSIVPITIFKDDSGIYILYGFIKFSIDYEDSFMLVENIALLAGLSGRSVEYGLVIVRNEKHGIKKLVKNRIKLYSSYPKKVLHERMLEIAKSTNIRYVELTDDYDNFYT